jgi:hypothetical protein
MYAWSPGGCTTSACTGLCGGINYSVTITDNKGCTKKDTISLNPLPVTVSMTVTPATCPSCPDGNATANPAGGTSPFSYHWNNGQTTQTATGLSPGYYPVCVYDADSCSKCDSIYVGFATGIIETHLENISIYPNPTCGIFVIASEAKQSQIEIYNVYGEKVYEDNSTVGKEINITLPLGLGQGIYFLRIKNKEGVITKKIILSR